MFSSLLFVLVLAFDFEIKNTLGHNVFENVAYGKYASQSTELVGGKFVASKAVNGVFNDFTHTDLEKNPWIRIDLGRNYTVHEVEVFGRKDCCFERLHDLDIKVGNDLHEMHLCGHFSGSCTRAGERITAFNTAGRYMEIRIVEGWNNILSVAEVLV